MSAFNPHFAALRTEYIFPIIEQKVEAARAKNSTIINLGIGDVALPLAPAIVEAICKATLEMGQERRGYGPSTGYHFLKEAIAHYDYGDLISPHEIFISDGINSDAVNIQDLFAHDATVAICNPTYPAYLDASVMHGKKIVLLPLLEENGFVPELPDQKVDLVYLCCPSNPTGTALTRAQLARWVAWAHETGAILIYDNAYMAFIRSDDVPKTIYEIDGAKEVAIELRSFSKTAGFTGLRCAYSVVANKTLLPLWTRRQNVKSNGVAYPIQKGALAAYTDEGRRQTQAQIALYQSAAAILREALYEQPIFGGTDAPYIWWKTPNNMTSWKFFDLLLEQGQIITVPGVGFGSHGEGYVRLSCFTTPKLATEAGARLNAIVH